MQQIYGKITPLISTVFSSTDSPKKWTTIPQFMLTANFEPHSKPLSMFQLQRSWLNSITFFRQLVSEIFNFNKELMEIKNHIQIPNYLKTYHLYKNLHEQLQTLNSISSSVKQAKDQLQQIKRHFYKEKARLREIRQPKMLPGIKALSVYDPEEEQNLRKTIRDIKTKREYQVHTLMPRTSYPQHLPYKDRTFEYKNEQSLMDLSQTVSVFSQSTPYESQFLTHNPSVQSLHSKSKSVSNFKSTTWTSQAHNYSSFLNRNSKLNQSREKKITPFSQVFQQKKKRNFTNHSHFKSASSLTFTPRIQTKFNKHSTKLLDNMVIKDKIEKIICEPDPQIVKNISKKDSQKPFQTLNINSSRISFIIKPQKNQLLNRRQFLSVKSELTKFKKAQNRFRIDLNRKLEFRKYMSNHILQQKNQVSKNMKYPSLSEEVGKKIMSLPKKQVDLTKGNSSLKLSESIHGSKLNIILQQTPILDPVEQKKRQFENQLRKQSIKSTLSNYMKYLNHLPQNNEEAQNNSELSNTVTSNLSSHFKTTRKSFLSQSEKKFQSLTTFRSASLQKSLGSEKDLVVLKALNKHSIQRNNEEIVDDVVKIKLRMAQSFNPSGLSSMVKNKNLFKGLELHHAPEQTEYQIIQPKLFSNPFFVAPKPSKKGKKKKK